VKVHRRYVNEASADDFFFVPADVSAIPSLDALICLWSGLPDLG
jgi:hypothetical protein